MPRSYYVYILMNESSTSLYVGITNDLMKCLWEHRTGEYASFTKKYRITRLVYYEETSDMHAAIAREKQVKRWRREKKVALVNTVSPEWRELTDGW